MNYRTTESEIRRMRRRIGQLEQLIRQSGLEVPAWGDDDHVDDFCECLTGKITVDELGERMGVTPTRARTRLERWYAEHAEPKPLADVAQDVFKPWIEGKISLHSLAKAHGVQSFALWCRIWSLHAPEVSELKSISVADCIQYQAGNLSFEKIVENYGMDEKICRSRLDRVLWNISEEEWVRAAERGEIPWRKVRRVVSDDLMAKKEEALVREVMAGCLSIEEFRDAAPSRECLTCRGSGENWDVNIEEKTSRKILCIKCHGWGGVRAGGQPWPADIVQGLLEKKQAKG